MSRMKRPVPISLTIALIALALSGFNFYYQFLRESHDFMVTVLGFEHHDSEISTTFALINNGNRTEVLASGHLVRWDINEKTFSYRDDNLIAPVVVEPGGRVLVTHSEPLAEGDVCIQIGLLLDSLDHDGETVSWQDWFGELSREGSHIGSGSTHVRGDLLSNKRRETPGELMGLMNCTMNSRPSSPPP